MKFLDFTTLFNTEPASFAVLSTFQFDPDFFERRLLRCPALAKARRILVFMDAGQWLNLLDQDVPARLLNRRYLVVPVRPSRGVFHPKLNLLILEQGAQVQCGSNNLTRSGCSSNLELLNSISFDLKDGNKEAIHIVQEAYAFFKFACNDAREEAGRIARQWLEELPKIAPWLTASGPEEGNRGITLLSTYGGSLWDQLLTLLDRTPPRKLLVMSPFYDVEGEMVERVHQRWTKCMIELIVQQQYTNLPVSPLRKLRKRLNLSALNSSSRRLHAKLLAWEAPQGTGCLVGSPNFTTAAYDGRNIETCLLLSEADEFIQSLFDKQLGTSSISLDEFDPGTERESGVIDDESIAIRLTSALLSKGGKLRLEYRHSLKPEPTSLRLALRAPGEQRPRALIPVSKENYATVTVTPPETALAEAHGTIFASLVAEAESYRIESPSIWVIQEGQLTYEPSGEKTSSLKTKIAETGQGLAEFLEELGKREGVGAVIEYLRYLNIQFYDGRDGLSSFNKFRLRIHDPFQHDFAPEWLQRAKEEFETLAEVIYDFADRHERQRLRRHAKRGNINGMENFVDIFTALVRILYVYYVRKVIDREKFIGRLCTYLEIASAGIDLDNDFSEGYLHTLDKNLSGDTKYLQEVCDELNLLGHLYAALGIVQKVRYVPNEKVKWGQPPKRPSECLPTIKDTVKNTIEGLGLSHPPKQRIIEALREYNMFSSAELAELEKEIGQ
jgi:hypothetical protein